MRKTELKNKKLSLLCYHVGTSKTILHTYAIPIKNYKIIYVNILYCVMIKI